MSQFTRVRLNDTGAHVTVGTVRAGMTVLKQDATDASGRPLPDEPAPTKTTARRRRRAASTTDSATAASSTTSGGDAADVS